MTLPEVLLWEKVRARRLEGFLIRRQHPIGTYVLDFYCDEGRLAIEVDGQEHSLGTSPKRDEKRDQWLAVRGVRTLRLPARVVLSDMNSALLTILAELPSRPPPPRLRRGPPPPTGEDLKE